MFSKINSICLHGMEAKNVAVEADVSDGLPGYSLVGYLASEVREAQDRVRTAIRNLKLSLPPKKVTINLSPADLRKEGTGFDLAIAAAILAAYGFIPETGCDGSVLVGELGLDGKVKGIPGILSLTEAAKSAGMKQMFLPQENLHEASVIEGIRLIGVTDLKMFIDIIQGKLSIQPFQRKNPQQRELIENRYGMDFSEINGQQVLKRAAEVAASGMHNILMIGPAGSGKTMAAKRLPTILPSLELEECIEISKIYSVCHLLNEKQPLITARPFRAPHHSVTVQTLIGGGNRPRPGEISLATGGVLFLDELPEMARASLEALRQPLEERCVTVSRVMGSYQYPADFQLAAAMNPCRCGHYPDRSRCTCTDAQIRAYLGKVSRPLLDRIDICVEAAPVSYEEISSFGKNEDSATIRKRVEEARRIQTERFKGYPIRCNAQMSGSLVRKFCILGTEEATFLKHSFQDFKLSARMYDKILKIARTTADMEGREAITMTDLSEAITYVRVREKYWNNG